MKIMKKLYQLPAIIALACLLQSSYLAQASAPSSETAALPDLLTIEAATKLFMQRNLAVEAARLEVSVAAAERVVASLRPRPGVTMTGENLSIGGPTAFNRLYEVGMLVTQPFELGGRAARRKEVAERTVELAEARLANVLQRRLLDLRRGYFEAVLARANLEIARENRTSFEELVRFNTVRLKEGDVAEGELIRVRLEKVKFDSSVAAASLAYEQAKVRLLELIGVNDYTRAASLDLGSALDFTPVAVDSAHLRETALANRAEIKIAEAEQSLAEATLRLEESRGKGEMAPFVGYKRVGVDKSVLEGLTVPLPFGNRNQVGIARASAQQQVAGTNLQLVRNRVLAEVEAAYLAHVTARDQVRAYRSGLLDQAQESITITLAAYREGVTPLINLIDARRTRGEVHSNYLKALYDYRNSLFTLEQVTGTEIQ